MWLQWFLASVLVGGVVAPGGGSVSVSQSSCGSSHNVNYYFYLKYFGSYLSSDPCTYTFTPVSWREGVICVEPEQFDLPCNVKVKYKSGDKSTRFDQEFDCHTIQEYGWCTGVDKLTISFERDTGSGGGNTNFHLRLTLMETFSDSGHSVVTTKIGNVVIIIVVVIAVIVALCVIATIVACCVCNKRRTSAGTVYRSPQQAAATTGSNTAQPSVAYQPNQVGYRPPQQAGYQPPPQGYQPGYQPQAQGYATGAQPPQQYQAAGYQPGQATSMTEKPPMTDNPIQSSAPPAGEYPMSNLPPPYPGN